MERRRTPVIANASLGAEKNYDALIKCKDQERCDSDRMRDWGAKENVVLLVAIKPERPRTRNP